VLVAKIVLPDRDKDIIKVKARTREPSSKLRWCHIISTDLRADSSKNKINCQFLVAQHLEPSLFNTSAKRHRL
jgi:hypothetical protein